jgi:sulfonate transport system substrate-binding protein
LTRRALAALLGLVLLLAAAGCGDDDDDTSAAPPSSAPSASAVGATDTSAAPSVTPTTTAATTAATSGLDPAKPVKVTIGVPRSFGYFSTMWARDTQIPGVDIEYKYFPVFQDMLAAINGGQIDLTEVGDVGAIQSYLNGGDVRVIAVTQPNDGNVGLLVPKDSPAKSIADLKGKKIAFLRSTNSYTFFLHLVQEAGLKESDFQVVEISGPDGNAAFANGQVDAYFSIDPNMADLIEKTGGRIIVGGPGYAQNLYPYLATTKAVEDKAPALRAVVAALSDTITWVHANPDQQAALLAPKLGFSETAIETSYARGSKALQPIDATFYASEQAVADELLQVGIIKKPIEVPDLFLGDFNDALAGTQALGLSTSSSA